MIHDLFNATTIPALEQWVNFAQSRHNILASNVANIDVPGYKTRDLSVAQFQGKLREAISARDADRSSASPITGERLAVDPLADVGRDLNGILYHDQSNVGIEQQVAEITKNHLQHNLALTVLNSQFRLLQAAVTERA